MLIDVPARHLAAIVTYLEMTAPPAKMPDTDGPLEIVRRPEPETGWYRALFRRVGEEWLWFSRLRMSDDELRAVIHHPEVDVFAVREDGVDIGFIELDRRRHPREIELAFFGVTPEATGRGAGRQMMAFALAEAWRHGPEKFTLHTCSLDHPRALEFYLRHGFRPVRRAVEIEEDPRMTGEIRPGCSAGFPLL
jgi:GNAT superfamily N-acetyltransferase